MKEQPKIIKGVLIDTTTNEIKAIDFEHNDYKDFHTLIHCDYFDIVTRKFGDTYCDIFCDDEGLIKGGKKIPSIFTFSEDKETMVEQIVGSVFICDHDDEGNSISLNEQQLSNIIKSIRLYNDDEDKIMRYCCIATL